MRLELSQKECAVTLNSSAIILRCKAQVQGIAAVRARTTAQACAESVDQSGYEL